MNEAEPVKRTSEIEEPTNAYVIHPISSRLTPLLARAHISPNTVSIAGMSCGIVAGVAYSHYAESSLFSAIGLSLMIMWHILDGADGQLARLTHSQSELGKVLDGVCDYVTFTSVYVGLAWASTQEHGYWVWGLAATAGVCHAVQSAAYEVQRQNFEYWGLGRLSAASLDVSATSPPASATILQRLVSALNRAYVRIQVLVTGVDDASRERLITTLALRPEHASMIRRLYREAYAPGVRRWSIMSANYHTIMIFVFALARVPLYYFFFEVFGLSAVTAALLAGQRGRYRAFVASLPTAE